MIRSVAQATAVANVHASRLFSGGRSEKAMVSKPAASAALVTLTTPW